MNALKFTLQIEYKEDNQLKELLRRAVDLEKIGYSVERFTGDSGETTTVTFDSLYSYNLKVVADLIHSIFDEGSEMPLGEDE